MISLFLVGLAVVAVAFTCTWLISVKIRNYGLLDAAWSYGIALLAPLYAWFGPGDQSRRILFTVVGVAWSLRLGTYILRRVLRHHPKEDERYEKLRQLWPGPGMFLVFFQVQALIIAIFSIPFLLAAFNTAPSIGVIEWTGLLLGVASLTGEMIADAQMKRFKQEPANHGKVCQVGLWRYSRHPNYFFEFCFWVGIAVAALGSPFGWISIVCPALILHFLLKVTGIPLTEEYAVRSKGDAYRAYQKSTSAFAPWFPK